MIIDLRKIKKSLNPKNQTVPVMSEYDPLWGFYTVTQNINYTYDESGKKGYSIATVTINGCFTINAEKGKILRSQSEIDKKENSNILFKKYLALRSLFVSKSKMIAPRYFAQYGTSQDKRCIALPSKLKNVSGGTVYMRPTGIGLTAERSPVILQYSATLEEVKNGPCRIVLSVENDVIPLNNASIQINGRKPRISPLLYAFANGGNHVFNGYDNRKITIQGTVSGNNIESDSNVILKVGDDDIIDRIDNAVERGYIGVCVESISTTKIFDVFIDGGGISFRKDKGNASVSFSGEIDCISSDSFSFPDFDISITYSDSYVSDSFYNGWDDIEWFDVTDSDSGSGSESQ